jgi:serine/threonine protein phosphatase PrpC
MNGWSISAFTHRGRVRKQNEDAIAVGSHILFGDMDTPMLLSTPNDSCLLMIADGMGGHAHGAMASRAVLDHLVAAVDQLSDPTSCSDAIEDANQRLFELMRQHDSALGMGTTVVGAVLTAEQLLTFNIGDSRCYLFSAGQLVQLSRDDVPEGENDVSGHRRSHALTQALGGSSFPINIEPHVAVDAPLVAGETLLLCSDGLTDMVSDQSISSTLRGASAPLQSVRKLAAKAFGSGARDNVSIIAAQLTEAQPKSPSKLPIQNQNLNP